MKNSFFLVIAFVFGLSLSFALPVLAQIIDTKIKIIDESDFSQKFATSSVVFDSEKEFELEKVKYDQNRQIIDRLDKIIYLLRRQND